MYRLSSATSASSAPNGAMSSRSAASAFRSSHPWSATFHSRSDEWKRIASSPELACANRRPPDVGDFWPPDRGDVGDDGSSSRDVPRFSTFHRLSRRPARAGSPSVLVAAASTAGVIVTRGGCGVSSSAGAGAGAPPKWLAAPAPSAAPTRRRGATTQLSGGTPDAAGSGRRGDCCVDGRERQACFGVRAAVERRGGARAARAHRSRRMAIFPRVAGRREARGEARRRGLARAATALPALLFRAICG